MQINNCVIEIIEIRENTIKNFFLLGVFLRNDLTKFFAFTYKESAIRSIKILLRPPFQTIQCMLSIS